MVIAPIWVQNYWTVVAPVLSQDLESPRVGQGMAVADLVVFVDFSS